MRRAVWRCFFGASRSSSSHPSIVAFHGSSTADTREGLAFRGGGTGDTSACRTVRRCVLNRRANARTDSSSRSRAFRICSNNSTFDLVAMDHTVEPTTPRVVDPRRHEDPPGVGPNQMSTRLTGGARSDEHTQPSSGGWCPGVTTLGTGSPRSVPTHERRHRARPWRHGSRQRPLWPRAEMRTSMVLPRLSAFSLPLGPADGDLEFLQAAPLFDTEEAFEGGAWSRGFVALRQKGTGSGTACCGGVPTPEFRRTSAGRAPHNVPQGSAQGVAYQRLLPGVSR
jgi:hypothetical protein